MIVGLTGGIGSGKTTVAKMFKEKGIPVYIADDEAKKLMNTDLLKHQIIQIFGEKAYSNGELNRQFIANQVFKNQRLLEKLNGIVHPAVRNHFSEWVAKQNASFVLYEAAILFEKGGDEICDYTILVTAPKEIRINRIQQRDEAKRTDIVDRMNNQWSDDKKKKLADFIVENIDLDKTQKKVQDIYELLVNKVTN
ncbi:MAG: dephospho-CoA kinase [Bacteroidota bacterium]